jgi:hypothetical protein
MTLKPPKKAPHKVAWRIEAAIAACRNRSSIGPCQTACQDQEGAHTLVNAVTDQLVALVALPRCAGPTMSGMALTNPRQNVN